MPCQPPNIVFFLHFVFVKSINSTVEEKFFDNNLILNFNIEETSKIFVEKINIFGNTITRESVIRNQLEIDEGDPFNELLQKKK